MLTREAQSADIPRILEMGSRSLEDGPYAGIIQDVPAQARKCADLVMAQGKILLAEEKGNVVGLVGFVVTPQIFSGELHGAELMWYVEPEHRASMTAIVL